MDKIKFDPKNPHIRTFTDKKFFFLDIKPEDICIEDIAHSLSYMCRYGGHCHQFYCPTPDQRILTDDLQWISAGDLVVGNRLVGFDEYPIVPGSTGNRRRRFRPSIITHMQKIKRQVLRIEMEDGQTVCASAEHPWLIATEQSRNQTWCTSDKIRKDVSDGRNRYMHVFMDPWQTIDSRDAGWLAGMFDGEGYLSLVNRRGVQCAVSQNPGIISNQLKRILTQFGFYYGTSITGKSTETHSVHGGFREILRLLGTIRPNRLVDKFTNTLNKGEFDKQLDGKGIPKKIVKVYDEGILWVSGIETDTHTYLCEGFGAHNSVAEHSIKCCERSEGRSVPLWGLLHDAAEAYIGDICKPLKSLLSISVECHRCIESYEQDILRVIAIKFKLPWPIPQEIHKIDKELLYEEMVFLWDGTIRKVLNPQDAEYMFLCHFDKERNI